MLFKYLVNFKYTTHFENLQKKMNFSSIFLCYTFYELPNPLFLKKNSNLAQLELYELCKLVEFIIHLLAKGRLTNSKNVTRLMLNAIKSGTPNTRF